MKKISILSACLFISSSYTMQESNLIQIKSCFKQKINWTKDNQIKISSASTIPGILLNCTTVHIPESMKEEFNAFFEGAKSKEHLEALQVIAAAIKNEKQSRCRAYKRYRDYWPKSIAAVADLYVKQSDSCLVQ